MIEKVVGPECPKCACQASEILETKFATIYGRRPGSSQLVVLAEETRQSRGCEHCGHTFRLTIKRTPPVAVAAAPQARCHYCGSANVRQVEASRPTRSGIVYSKMKCHDCQCRFNLTVHRPAA